MLIKVVISVSWLSLTGIFTTMWKHMSDPTQSHNSLRSLRGQTAFTPGSHESRQGDKNGHICWQKKKRTHPRLEPNGNFRQIAAGAKICTSIGKIDVIFSHTHQLLSALAYFDLKSMPRRQNWHFFMLMFGKFFSENSANNVQNLLVCYSFYSLNYEKRML